MKRIIVPTDFSKGAWNALLYAMDMAQALNVKKILIVNAYFEPHSGAATIVSIEKIMKEDSHRNMEKWREKINTKGFGELFNLELKSIHAPLVATLNDQIKGKSGQLIVMGTRGESGTLEKLIGSNASAVVSKVACPVLVIPEDARFSFTGKLVLAADAEKLPDHVDLELIKAFTDNHPKARLEVVQVTDNGVGQDPQSFKKFLKDIPYQYHLLNGQDVAAQLDHYVSQQPTDMLMMIRPQRGVFQQLFHKSITKKLTLHAKVPLLVLKESS